MRSEAGTASMHSGMPTPTGVGCRGERDPGGDQVRAGLELAATLVVLAYLTMCWLRWLREPGRAGRDQGVQARSRIHGRACGCPDTVGYKESRYANRGGYVTMRWRCRRNPPDRDAQRPLLVRTEAPPPTEAQWGYYQRLCRDTRIAPRMDLNRQSMSREIDLLLARLGRG